MAVSLKRKTDKVRSKNKTKKTVNRPGWDNSTTDLSVYRLSANELERRHLLHISKNKEEARKDLYDHPKLTSPSPLTLSTSNTERKTLHSLLAQTDKTLAGVKDLFSDDPKCYRGRPNITIAPHILANKENLDRTLQEASVLPPTVTSSPGGIRDNSIVGTIPPPLVLNDMSLTTTDKEDGNPAYQSSINFNRFHSYIEQETTPTNQVTPNATIPSDETDNSVAKMLEQLKLQVHECKKEMGGDDHTPHFPVPNNEDMTGSLIHIAIELTTYLRQAQRQLTEERTLQEQLLLSVEEQQELLDTVASDIIKLEEKCQSLVSENKELKTQLNNLQQSTDNNIKKLQEQLNEMKGGGVVPTQPQFFPIFVPGPHPPLGVPTPSINPYSKSTVPMDPVNPI